MFQETKRSIKVWLYKNNLVRFKDWPELEGNTVVSTQNGGTMLRVAGCCYDVGITFVLNNNPEEERLCLNYKWEIEQMEEETYDKIFYMIVDSIIAGEYEYGAADMIKHGTNTAGHIAPCAFK